MDLPYDHAIAWTRHQDFQRTAARARRDAVRYAGPARRRRRLIGRTR